MWVKIDDQMPNDPEIDELSDGAFRLYVSALCYCQAELTDGYITASKLKRLVPNYKPSQLRELTGPTLHPEGPIFAPIDDGYIIRNFTKYNKTRAHWEKRRADDAKRMADWRAARDAEIEAAREAMERHA